MICVFRVNLWDCVVLETVRAEDKPLRLLSAISLTYIALIMLYLKVKYLCSASILLLYYTLY